MGKKFKKSTTGFLGATSSRMSLIISLKVRHSVGKLHIVIHGSLYSLLIMVMWQFFVFRESCSLNSYFKLDRSWYFLQPTLLITRTSSSIYLWTFGKFTNQVSYTIHIECIQYARVRVLWSFSILFHYGCMDSQISILCIYILIYVFKYTRIIFKFKY
jgi:hypothetical protein